MKEWSRRDKGLAGLVLALGLTLRLVPALTLPPPPIGGDAVAYDRLAHNLASGHGYSMSKEAPYFPSAIRPPVYPVFLSLIYALFGQSPRAAWVVQGTLDMGTCLLMFWLALRLFDQRYVALMVLFLANAILPSQVYARYLITEALAAFLLTAMVAVWVLAHEKPGRYEIPLGLLVATIALCRPEFSLFPLVILALLMIQQRRLRYVFGIVAGYSILVFPWFISRAVCVDKTTTVRSGAGIGTTLWAGTWGEPGVVTYHRKVAGRDVLYLPADAYNSLQERQQALQALSAHLDVLHGRHIIWQEEKSPDAVLLGLALNRICRSPGKWLWLRIREFPLLWQPSLANWENGLVRSRTVNIMLGWFFLVTSLGGIGLSIRKPTWQPISLSIVYYVLVHFPFHTEFRFGVTMYPLVMLLSVGFFHELRERGKNRAKV